MCTPTLCWFRLSPPPLWPRGLLLPWELPENPLCSGPHWVCWWCCCVPVCVALLGVGPGAPGSDFASGPGSGPAALHSVCALGHLSCAYAPWQYLWVTVSRSGVSSLSCPFKICLHFQSQIEPGLPLPLPPPSFPPDLVSVACILEVLLGNKETLQGGGYASDGAEQCR